MLDFCDTNAYQNVTTYLKKLERKTVENNLTETLENLCKALNVIKNATYKAQGFPETMQEGYDTYHVKKVGKKYAYIDSGGSGVFLVEVSTGELYNIKAYGVADFNKKKKADIGNVYTVNPEVLYTKRWNYLR
jgi:hypothetical protein